ncbi:MAG: hypothetical protein WDZ29_08325 [Balneolaceae bacterium]
MFYTRVDGHHIAHFYNGLNTSVDSARQTFMLANSDGDVLNPEPLVIPDRYSILRGGRRVLEQSGILLARFDWPRLQPVLLILASVCAEEIDGLPTPVEPAYSQPS